MRRRKAKKIAILPDPKFNDVVVTKFVNNLMLDGKKSLAFKILYDALIACIHRELNKACSPYYILDKNKKVKKRY